MMNNHVYTADGRTVKSQIVRSCVGITAAVCVLYGAYSLPRSQADTHMAAAESPRLVILGREEEETVTLIAESIQQEDGSILSLEDFLGTLICGACSRKCPLLSPRCRRGMSKAEAQSAYYDEAVELIGQSVGTLYNRGGVCCLYNPIFKMHGCRRIKFGRKAVQRICFSAKSIETVVL